MLMWNTIVLICLSSSDVSAFCHFLVATLYVTMSVRRSVGPSVSRSVGPSVRRSVITSRFWAFRAERRANLSYCPCPDAILPLPTRTRLMLPCIRPCFLINTHFLGLRLIVFKKFPFSGWRAYKNKAVYTTSSVACGWVGAVWQLRRGSNSNLLSFQL